MSEDAARVPHRRVLVTGADGMVGRALVAELTARGHAVRGLSRSTPVGGRPAPWAGGEASRVGGNVREPEAWRNALDGSNAVIHLAASTGKASAAQHHATNVEGTRALLAACGRVPVERFLFVSSIAAGFPDRPDYPYARSKAAAESVVAASGGRQAIVRPTIVVGPGSGSLAGLESLARLPVLPLLGGGRAPVQPIWVGDLAMLLRRILERDRFDGERLELGGPEVLTIGELLRRIRRLHGRGARALSLPARPILALLGVAGKVAGPLLPVTAGQLASFVHDGTAEPNSLIEEARGELKSVDEMLAASGIGRPTAGENNSAAASGEG